MGSACDRLCEAIGYPAEELRGDKSSRILLIDDVDYRLEEGGGRLVFSRTLRVFEDGGDSSLLESLAGYAAGRLLKEEAVLAWDENLKALILWQSVPSDASGDVLKRSLELFLVSCDWWSARLEDESSSGGRMGALSEMVIMP